MKRKATDMYFKSFREDMTGADDFQFKVGKVYADATGKTGFHYTWDVYTALACGHLGRVCVVEPLVRINTSRSHDCYRNMPFYMKDKIWTVRELGRDETIKELAEEGAPFYMMLKMDTPFEVLLKYKNALWGEYCFKEIRKLDYLTDEQKKELFPKCWRRKNLN